MRARRGNALSGCLEKRKLQPDQGIWLEPCTAVHTIGMQMPVDIILLDASHRVIAILPGVCPMCALVTRPGTHVVIELKSGAAAHSGIAVGNHLSLEAA